MYNRKVLSHGDPTADRQYKQSFKAPLRHSEFVLIMVPLVDNVVHFLYAEFAVQE